MYYICLELDDEFVSLESDFLCLLNSKIIVIYINYL